MQKVNTLPHLHPPNPHLYLPTLISSPPPPSLPSSPPHSSYLHLHPPYPHLLPTLPTSTLPTLIFSPTSLYSPSPPPPLPPSPVSEIPASFPGYSQEPGNEATCTCIILVSAHTLIFDVSLHCYHGNMLSHVPADIPVVCTIL